MSKQRNFLVIALVVLAMTGGALFSWLALQKPAATTRFATVLPEPMALPDFELIDQHGNPFNRESITGHWSLVFFGFTHCPDICPATLQQLALARDQVNESGGGRFPDIILVSVDPERDTPDILKAYTASFGSGVSGVTGAIGELKKLTSATGIFFQKSAQTGDNYSVDHSAVVLVINPNGEFHGLFSAPHTVDQFAEDVPVITGIGAGAS